MTREALAELYINTVNFIASHLSTVWANQLQFGVRFALRHVRSRAAHFLPPAAYFTYECSIFLLEEAAFLPLYPQPVDI